VPLNLVLERTRLNYARGVNVPKKLKLFSNFWVWKSERSCIRSKAQLSQRRHGRVKLGQAANLGLQPLGRTAVSGVHQDVAHRLDDVVVCGGVGCESDARPELGTAPGLEDLVASPAADRPARRTTYVPLTPPQLVRRTASLLTVELLTGPHVGRRRRGSRPKSRGTPHIRARQGGCRREVSSAAWELRR
jgi:hypothetical protein